ncbi:DUF72 domain-containing protein [Sphingomonas astaxanthinifaciens]|uniref:DUF72 domain-containing protein n=1 Tax=Sphingomonas astaxanthinifaciens DSM 22298 TaxID=1123267 RepID=A0ABQ5Z5A0_9SPHN|nr:DUF72 domain-containing protein [Sphingomonas astaxanthinifaciens]GLR47196.1 hypothetical protein GCM10007925_09070 [Sphingomonas astaxanthinifaciens DSM 22298]
MTIRVGIGGWTYEPWRGTFYPDGLPHRRELEYAAAQLGSIEINATAYGRQNRESWRKWRDAVPDGFRFSLKASRFSTVRKVLADSGPSIDVFLGQGFTELGEKLGPINWQFADTKAFERDDFARFLDLIPDSQDGVPLRHALEVRHSSFADPAFLELARARNMAVVFADHNGFVRIEEQTADFSYARLQRSVDDVATGYDDEALDGLAQRISRWAKGGRDVFVYFIGGAKVRNPAAALALMGRL